MGAGLLRFSPRVWTRRGRRVFSDARRKNPVRWDTEAFRKAVWENLPAGFKIDEMPDGGKLETPFGTYTCSYQAQGDELIFERKLEIRAATVPAEQYAALKTFFERVAGA